MRHIIRSLLLQSWIKYVQGPPSTGTNVLWSKNKARNSWWMQTIKVWAAGFLMCLWVVLMKYNRWFKLFQTLISKSLEGLIIHVPGGGRDCKCAFTAPIFYYNLLPLQYLSIPHWMCVCVHGCARISLEFGRNGSCCGGVATFWLLMTRC